MGSVRDIGIIGAGPAGLCAAIYLRRLGINVTIYEQFEEAKPVGSGLMLQPTGLSILHELGLLEATLERGQRIGRILGRDAFSTKAVLDVYYAKLGGGRFGLGIHRSALFRVLFDAAIDEDVNIELKQEITRLDITSGHVRPVTDNGRILAKHDLIVVADGSNSAIANNLFGLKELELLPFGALWATVDWPQSGFDKTKLEQRYSGASEMVGVLPLGNISNQHRGDKKAALFWSMKGAELGNLEKAGIDAWKENVKSYWPQTEIILNKISGFDELTYAGYRHYTLKKPFGDRVVFIGDAYHSTSPQLGQGANMALLDAKALDFAIRQCGDSVHDIGEMYYSLRRRQISVFQFLSRFLTPFYQSDSRVLGFVRDHLVSQLVKIPPAPWLMAAMVSGLMVEPFGRGIFSGSHSLKLDEPDWHNWIDQRLQ